MPKTHCTLCDVWLKYTSRYMPGCRIDASGNCIVRRCFGLTPSAALWGLLEAGCGLEPLLTYTYETYSSRLLNASCQYMTCTDMLRELLYVVFHLPWIDRSNRLLYRGPVTSCNQHSSPHPLSIDGLCRILRGARHSHWTPAGWTVL